MMGKCFNVIYRDLRATTHYSATARTCKNEADTLCRKLKALGWDVIIDPSQPLATALLNAPVIDIYAAMKQGVDCACTRCLSKSYNQAFVIA